jgi:hypothetical protein
MARVKRIFFYVYLSLMWSAHGASREAGEQIFFSFLTCDAERG